jgi:malate synthase
VERFGGRLGDLLDRRAIKRGEYNRGLLPAFLTETAGIRQATWKVAPVPEFLQDRRVEITGPTDRKMMINALNSGAKVFMADLEDSTSPTWENVTEGQVNLYDAVRGTIEFTNDAGKHYELNDETAVLFVRPRGLHLLERHVRFDGRPIPAALFDFGMFFFHNAHALIEQGVAPCFYLPKLESHHEARLWNKIFVYAQQRLGIPVGTVRATVLIETLPAAFEMDEILYELREHSAGLNCGRWDYIFSVIKVTREHGNRVLPDRAQVTMTQPFMRAYTRLLVRTCHKRGVHAMGGMSAFIPVRGDDEANTAAFDAVIADKAREAVDGHDGTWVAHPGLIPVAKQAFDAVMPGANQIDKPLETDSITGGDLLAVAEGSITWNGVHENVRVGLRYLASWLGGAGCVPLFNLMEDAATAEICRAQLWQWVRHGALLDDDRMVTEGMVRGAILDEVAAISRDEPGVYERLDAAAALFEQLCVPAFLTLPASKQLD